MSRDAIHKAQVLLDAGRPRQALELLTHFLTQEPDHPTALTLCSVALGQLDRWRDSMSAAEAAVRSGPNQVAPWCVLAIAAAKCNRADIAKEAIGTARRLDPLSSWPLRLGIEQAIASRAGRREALADARRLIELEPEEAASFVTFGNLLLSLRRRSDARAQFRRALEIDPTNEAAQHNIALLAPPGEVLGALPRVVKADPTDAHSRRSRRAVLLRYFIGVQALLWLGVVGLALSITTRTPGQWFPLLPTVVVIALIGSISLIVARVLRAGGPGSTRVFRGLLRDEPFVLILMIAATVVLALLVFAGVSPWWWWGYLAVPLLGFLWFGGGIYGFLRPWADSR